MNTVLITGSNRGIGKAIKEAFEKRGDKVIGHTRSSIGDVRELQTIKKISKLANDNNINILINNAGIYSEKSIDTIEDETIKAIIEVNLIATLMQNLQYSMRCISLLADIVEVSEANLNIQ